MTYDANNPTTEGRPCKLSMAEDGKCPGTIKGCSFWRVTQVERNQQAILVQNCLFHLQYEAQYQGVGEAIHTQQSIQHFNNQMHMNVLAFQRGIAAPPLSGNLEKDVQTIKQFVKGDYRRVLAERVLDESDDGDGGEQS